MAQLQLVKSGKNFKVLTDGTTKFLMVERVRVSFPAIGHMKEDEGDDGEKRKSYQATPMLPKPTHVEAKNAFVEIMNELLEANGENGKPVKVLPENKCIKNGDDTEREEYQDHWIIASKDSKIRPTARDMHGKLIFDPTKTKNGDAMEAALDKIDEIFYGGVTVNILLRPWYFNGKAKGKTKTYPKRICCGLVGIQHVEDTPSFGMGRIDDSGAWGSVDGAEDSTDGEDDDGGL